MKRLEFTPQENAKSTNTSKLKKFSTILAFGAAMVAGENLAAQEKTAEKARSTSSIAAETKEAAITPERIDKAIELMKNKFKTLFVSQLNEKYLKGGEDHYILVIGREVVLKDKTAGEVGYGKGFTHPGALEYSLVRAGFPLSKTFRNVDGKQDTLEHFIRHALQNQYIHDDTASYEYEWEMLLTAELIKRGKKVEVGIAPLSKREYPHMQLTLEHMHQKNTTEFREVFYPELLSAEENKAQKDGEGMMGSGPSCDGLHALHAMMAYELMKGNKAEVTKIVDFIVKKSEEKLKDLDNPDSFHFLAHLITPLTELSPNYSFTPREKEVLRSVVAYIVKTIEINKDSDLDKRVPEFAHAVDDLMHLPPQLK